MSTFLGFSSALVPINSTTSYLQSTFSSLLSGYTWRILRQAITPISIVGTATNPSYAFDMSTGTITTGTVPVTIGCQTAGFIPTFMHVKASSTSVTTAPATFTLDYSDNGSTWFTLQTWTTQNNWTTSEQRKYTVTGAASHTYWRISITAVQSSTTVNVVDWVLEDTNGNWITSLNFFDCIPPVGESIGNSRSREAIRWKFPSGTSINIAVTPELLTDLPQLLSVDTATAGAVTLSVTINAATVSYTGSATSNASQNLRGLYEALAQSANANFTPWNWIWLPGIAIRTGVGILAIQKTPAVNIAIPTSANCSARWRGTSVINTPLAQIIQSSYPVSITTDLINGFVYFLQVNSRGLAFATKTSSSYYAPIHVCYGDNASAQAQTPTSDLAAFGLPCFPIEAIVGTSDIAANSGGSGYLASWWGSTGSLDIWPLNGQSYHNVDYTNDAACGTFNHQIVAGILQNFSPDIFNAGGGLSNAAITMCAEGLASGADVVGNMYTIHRLASNYAPAYLSFSPSQGYNGRFASPYFVGLDWYKFTGAAPANEQLVVGPHTDFTATVATTGTSGDTTISVVSTTGFPASGWIVLEGEIIQYSGLTGGNTFTGCTRGMYNSQVVTPISGAKVYIGGWWVFIVQSLVFVGYQVPS